MSPGVSARRVDGAENLILTGFMGVGKSAVGREVARRLGREFVDMDALLEARAGKPIARIFAQEGEAAFRRMESALCRELAARSGLVIATGGGALLDEANREILAASGPVICLHATPDEILRRLAAATDRPLLNVPDRRARIAALLAERAEAYARIPLQLDTTGLTVAQVAEEVLALAGTAPARRLAVRYPGGEYPIHLGRGLLGRVGPLLREKGLGGDGGKAALVTNPTVGELYAGTVAESLEGAGFRVVPCLVPEGEAHKTLDTVRGLYDAFIEAGLDRGSPVLALGGGVIGDMAGFAAATYLRGVPLVQVPTSLLAMVDASVGGKVAVDHRRGKNLIGAFKQPELVVADPGVLATLPAAELRNGLAEVVKAGLIADPDLFVQMEDHGPAPLPWLIERAVRVKIAIVEEDPFEGGRRAVLNLGHTFGHALELLSGYRLRHGEGVAIGLVAAARLAARLGEGDPALPARIEALLDRLGLPTACDLTLQAEHNPRQVRRGQGEDFGNYTPAQIWAAMATDKKRRGGKLRFVLPRALGEVFIAEEVAQGDVLAVLETLTRDENPARSRRSRTGRERR